MNILLITENDLKGYSVLEDNVDVKILNRVIVDVQQLHLRPILGETLYNTVLDHVKNMATVAGYTIPATILTLLNDYITPYLIHAVMVDWIVTNQFKFTNKGLLKLNDNAATTATNEDLGYATNHFKNKMVSYKDALIGYLRKAKLLANEATTEIASDSIGWYLESSNITYADLRYKKRYGY